MIEVAAALIHHQNRLLITKRKEGAILGGYWEFPGGKCQEKETLRDCLQREIKEELGIQIQPEKQVCQILYPYPHGTVILYFFDASFQGGEPQALGCQEFRWILPQELPRYTFPPANTLLIRQLCQ